jgi:hypothetical protein
MTQYNESVKKATRDSKQAEITELEATWSYDFTAPNKAIYYDKKATLAA